ncbi:MAG TPA: arsenate reductase (glutaredoxin) [Woeseiaceae bacterium]|nr:arsenate reductase (glutaredoxin) [Woeseiaceae bacterium]
MSLTIYHNPQCSKSRRTLELIRERGIEPRIVEYLKNPPTAEEVLALARQLGRPVEAMLRKQEEVYKAAAGTLSHEDEALARWVSEHPRALERPVVVDEARGKAVIGRPPENVLELL